MIQQHNREHICGPLKVVLLSSKRGGLHKSQHWNSKHWVVEYVTRLCMSKNDCDKLYQSSINNIMMLPSLIIIHKSTCNVQIIFNPSTSVGGKRLVCFVGRYNLTIHVTYFHPLTLSLFLETSCSWDAHIYIYTYTYTYKALGVQLGTFSSTSNHLVQQIYVVNFVPQPLTSL